LAYLLFRNANLSFDQSTMASSAEKSRLRLCAMAARPIFEREHASVRPLLLAQRGLELKSWCASCCELRIGLDEAGVGQLHALGARLLVGEGGVHARQERLRVGRVVPRAGRQLDGMKGLSFSEVPRYEFVFIFSIK
jgi:hypothetical protein